MRYERFLRLFAYCAVLAVIGVIVSAQSLAAAASERSMLLGQQLGRFSVFAGKATSVVLNGQSFTLHTRMVQRPIGEVLDEFSSLCRRGAERATAEFAEHVSASTREEVTGLQKLFVMRDQREGVEGTAMCFAGLGDGSLSDVTARFARFSKNLDLSELGAMRYVYLRKNERGTHVLFVTSAGPMSLHRLWPTDGSDVEGSEPIAGARPKDSVRMISARLEGATRGLTAYKSPLSAAAALRDYAGQASAAGYEVLDFAAIGGGEKSLGLGDGVDVRVLRKDGGMSIATSMPDGAGSYLSVVQL